MVSFSLLVQAVFLAAMLPLVVVAKHDPVYVFTTEATDAVCNKTEWDAVLQTMENATFRRRRLIRLGPAMQQRQLACPRWCGKYCASMGVGCGQYRGRLRRELSSSVKCQGNSSNCVDGDVSVCAADIAAIDTALTSITNVSNSCRSVLNGGKTVSCPDFTIDDCYIRSFSLWTIEDSVPTLLVAKMNATGTTFCTHTKVSFRVEANFVVGKVTASIWGANPPYTRLDKGYRMGAAPYYVFGSRPDTVNGTQITLVEGRKFLQGSYILNAAMADDRSQSKRVSFTVMDCPET
jgi:hypothetical protein